MIQHKTNNTSGKGNTASYIMLHHTAAGRGSVNGTIQRFKNPKSKASAHYVVDENGQIYKFNTDDDILWHAGKGEWEGIKDEMNKHAIGIEVVGPLPGFTDQQRNSTMYLIDQLVKTHGISREKIIRHKDYSPTRKPDIADEFWNTVSPTFYERKTGKALKPDTVKDIMDLNSKRRNETQDGEERAVLESVNSYYRNKFK